MDSKEILTKAAEIINHPSKWTRRKLAGKFGYLPNGGCQIIKNTYTLDTEAKCFCIIGAIFKAADFDIEHIPYHGNDPSVRANFINQIPDNIMEAISKLKNKIPEFIDVPKFEGLDDIDIVEQFNDKYADHSVAYVLIRKAVFAG
jgi:hypothetical protein